MNPAPMTPPPVNPAPMNSPPTAPPPGSLMRALSGPLLLITLGALLTIDYMGGVSFGRSWPVLLIVFGLCRVTEHMGPRGA
jgi:hypothetical protein